MSTFGQSCAIEISGTSTTDELSGELTSLINRLLPQRHLCFLTAALRSCTIFKVPTPTGVVSVYLDSEFVALIDR